MAPTPSYEYSFTCLLLFSSANHAVHSLHQSGDPPSPSGCSVGAERCADKAQARAGPAGKNRTEMMVKKISIEKKWGWG